MGRRKSVMTRRAKESAELFPIKEDLAAWLNRLLGVEIRAQNFMDVLDNGVVLCNLVQRVQEVCQQRKDQGLLEQEVKLPLGKVKCHCEAEKRSFYARDNVSKFIDFARALGVQEAVLFESNGLVNHTEPKEVILTLLDFARRAAKYGIEPPDLVTLENEIDKEEAATAEEPVIVEEEALIVPDGPPEDEVDRLVREIIKRVGYQYPIRRLGEGRYIVEPGKTKLFVRVLREHIMVRVGGGWTTLEYFLVKHTPSKVKLTNYGSAEHVQKTIGVTLNGPDKSKSESCKINQQLALQPAQRPLPKGKVVSVSHAKSKSVTTSSTRTPSNPRQQKGSLSKTTGKQAVSSQVGSKPFMKQSIPAREDSKAAKPLQPLSLHSKLANSPYLGRPVRKAYAPSCFPSRSKSLVKQQPSRIVLKPQTKLSV